MDGQYLSDLMSENNLKEGDKVVCIWIGDDAEFTLNKVYNVFKDDNNGTFIRDDEGCCRHIPRGARFALSFHNPPVLASIDTVTVWKDADGVVKNSKRDAEVSTLRNEFHRTFLPSYFGLTYFIDAAEKAPDFFVLLGEWAKQFKK